MPSARSRLAPHFSGDIDHPIEEFLQEYEELVDIHGLTEAQKGTTVIRYVDTSQRHIWRSLPGFIDQDWIDLCDQLREEYVSPTAESKFSKQKLVKFVDKSARKRMRDEADVISYHRQFNASSKVLLDTGRVTTFELNAIYWRGFHPDDQRALHERLIAKQPERQRGRAFEIKDVFKIARAIFSGDDDFLWQEPPPRRSSPDRGRAHDQRETDRDARASGRGRTREPSPSESDDDIVTYSDHRRSSPRIETKSVRFSNSQRGSNDDDLGEMIGQLHNLSV